MKKYKLIGVTKYAERFLNKEDLEDLKNMIGLYVEESETPSIVDGKRMFIMPFGEDTHVDYLELEHINP